MRLNPVPLLTVFSFLTVSIAESQLHAQAIGGKPAAHQPHLDDAALNAVHSVGTQHLWSVGEHGVIRVSHDGGQSWEQQSSGVSATLTDVCFLSDKIGWAVGHEPRAFTGIGLGVILHTRDGGQHWFQVAAPALPRLRRVQFFSLEEGIVVGDSTTDFPTGILTTGDGGQTWQPIPGEVRTGWLAADFSDIDAGVVGGRRSQLTVVGGGRLLAPQFETNDDRAIRSVQLDREFRGWLVGDGGLVMKSDSGGVAWAPPNGRLPRELGQFTDFHTVAFRGQRVWIAGTPGSVIWHSQDGGQTWSPQSTGVTAPLRDLRFSSDDTGCAVGDFGTILRTSDGGQTWQVACGGLRRTALLVIVPRPDRLPLQLLSHYTADLGYRAHAIIPAREQLFRNREETTADDRAADAVRAVHGNGATIDWRLPLEVPDVQHVTDQLLAEWARLHEGNLKQVVLGQLAAQIRIWRPSVIVLDGGRRNDAVASVLQEAVSEAVAAAADPSRFPEQLKLAGLRPWSVERVVQRLPDGSRGTTNIDPDQVLPRVGQAVRVFTALGYSYLQSSSPAGGEAFSQVHLSPQEDAQRSLGHDLFAGLAIAPGSDARRLLTEVSDDDLARQEQLARRQKNFEAILKQSSDSALIPEQMLAHLHQMSAGMSPAQASLQLAELAGDYERRGQWQLAEATRVELVVRYPRQPAAIAARDWLLRFWSSSEMAWQRLRTTRLQRRRLTVDPERIDGAIQQANAQATVNPFDREGLIPGGRDALGVVQQAGGLNTRRIDLVPDEDGQVAPRVTSGGDRRSSESAVWLAQASRMAAQVQQQDEPLLKLPERQFTLASLERRLGNHSQVDDVLRRLQQLPDNHAWKRVVVMESWLQRPVGPPPLEPAVSRETTSRPHLDGVLGDPCWQAADPVRLTNTEPGLLAEAPETLVYFAHDQHFLYLAASVRRLPGLPQDQPTTVGRDYDADLTGFDRLVVRLDVDRDYDVGYQLEFDQRGWTRDRCWSDQQWNPRYAVAAEGQSDRWTIEVAIPLDELVPAKPRPSDVWAVGLSRVVPGAGCQSWHAPPSPEPRPEAAGLLQFLPPQPAR